MTTVGHSVVTVLSRMCRSGGRVGMAQREATSDDFPSRDLPDRGMSCQACKNLAPEYLENRLGQAERRTLEIHTGSCPACREYVAQSSRELQAIVEKEWARRDAERR